MSYFARALNKTETDLDMGTFGRMGVFRRGDKAEELLGSYIRNYGTNFDAFFPFRINGKDLALYSPDYTATRIMELPLCRDLGGEEPDDEGFCPVDYFVPTFIDQEVIYLSNNESFPKEQISRNRINNPSEGDQKESRSTHQYINGVTGQECEDTTIVKPIGSVAFYPFGFVAGCVWADESSWKVQYLDLSQADQGILKREERFGYIELPENIRLRDAIDMGVYLYELNFDDDEENRIRINVMQSFDLRSGKAVTRLDL